MKIKQSIALVTGASSCIGEATAEGLPKAGYKVYGTSVVADVVLRAASAARTFARENI